jgi:hypothetical protein
MVNLAVLAAQTTPQPADAFVAFLLIGLVLITLLIMGTMSLLGWLGERHGWSPQGASPGRLDAAPVRGRQVDKPSPVVSTPAGVSISQPAGQLDTQPASGQRQVGEGLNLPAPSLPAAEWLRLLNDQPDEVPHVVVVGGSGTGKTTFATALLASRAGQVCIITPKPDDDWGGLPAVTIDDDGGFRTASVAFSELLAEAKRRLVTTKRRQAPGDPITVVLDDYPALRAACPDADDAFLLIAQLGRSLRIRLIVLSYSGLVKELGLEGRGESRNHFVWVRLDRQRRAVLEWDERTQMLDTTAVPTLARKPISLARWWATPPATTTASESEDRPMPGQIGTTTTASPPPRTGRLEDEVVVVVPREGVSIAEQVSILKAAVQMQVETGRVVRTEVCRQVFDGQTGGAAYRKTMAVLDAAQL